jgi:hypothetical protein
MKPILLILIATAILLTAYAEVKTDTSARSKRDGSKLAKEILLCLVG